MTEKTMKRQSAGFKAKVAEPERREAEAGIDQVSTLPTATYPPTFAQQGSSTVRRGNLDYLSFFVYNMHMGRTNVDIDDEICAQVMKRYRLRTKREAINFALRRLLPEPLTSNEIKRLQGCGWEGDLDELRGAGDGSG